MPLEFNILTGAKAGRREHFTKSVIAIGRHPLSDLLFDPEKDLDVSTRHAEIRGIEGRWILRDEGSTNGTFVNDRRLAGEHELRDGDVVTFGQNGPRAEVHIVPEAEAVKRPSQVAATRVDTPDRSAPVMRASGATMPPSKPKSGGSTGERVAVAVKQQTRGLRNALIAVVALLVVGGGFVGWRMMSAKADTAAVLPAETYRLDLSKISRDNDGAVAFLVTELDGKPYGATAFGITSSGYLLTNRHNVKSDLGHPPTRIAIKFANTAQYFPAHVVKVSEDSTLDLAVVKIDAPGPFPVVHGIVRSSPVVGSEIGIIGFPFSTDLPMEGDTAKTTLERGTVSKLLSTLLQVSSFAGHGSSGSPVFNADGNVVGVVWGGAREAQGRIVYAVPAERIPSFLPDDARAQLR